MECNPQRFILFYSLHIPDYIQPEADLQMSQNGGLVEFFPRPKLKFRISGVTERTFDSTTDGCHESCFVALFCRSKVHHVAFFTLITTLVAAKQKLLGVQINNNKELG